MAKFFIYPNPLDSLTQIQHDNGWTADLNPDVDSNGRQGKSVEVPANTPNGHGARLVVSHSNKVTSSNRGFFVYDESAKAWRLQVDDVTLADVVIIEVPVDPPPTDTMPTDPAGIINYTYKHGKFDLTTKEGCGKFTEACCTNLHEYHHTAWGHVRKNPGQNQYNGHAVDAVMLLIDDLDGTKAGIYDIIVSSESSSAKPAFNYAGPSNPSLWYYPA